MSDERAALIALASSLQARAEALGSHAEEDSDFVGDLAEFNERTGASCTAAETFAVLYQSQEPEELVDALLEARTPAPPVPVASRRVLVEQVARVCEDPELTRAEGEVIGRALERVSKLPPGWAFSLVTDGYGFGWSASQAEALVEFVSQRAAIRDRETLLETTREYLEARAAGERSVFQHLRERLMSEAQARLELPELRSLMRAWQRRGSITDDAAVGRLRKRLGLD